jgi:hypothetical protein
MPKLHSYDIPKKIPSDKKMILIKNLIKIKIKNLWLLAVVGLRKTYTRRGSPGPQ